MTDPIRMPSNGPATVDTRQTSPWAIVSLMFSLTILCPLCTVVAPFIAWKGLSDIKARPEVYRGRRVAKAAILISILATLGWIAIAGVWHFKARLPMQEGPVAALQAASAGDATAFKALWHDPEGRGTDEAAQAFCAGMNRRYGAFISARIDEEATIPIADRSRGFILPIRYQMRFERGAVPAEARFVVTRSGQLGFVLAFESIVILDDEDGDLAYPSGVTAATAMPDQGGDGDVDGS